MLQEIKKLLPDTYPVFIGDLPAEPDNVCVLYLTGGFDPLREIGFQPAYATLPTFQVRVRATVYSDAISYIESARTALEGKTVLVNDNDNLTILVQSDALHLGKDDRGRSEFTLNFRCMYDKF